MPSDAVSLVRAFLAEHGPPLRVWAAPQALRELGPQLAAALRAEGTVTPIETGLVDAMRGPAILVAMTGELGGVDRPWLLRLAAAAQPGRPVVCGGTGDRDLVLDAINTWRVSQILPERPDVAQIDDALRRAHRAACLEHAAIACAEELRERCAEVRAVLRELELTRELLLHAERLGTIGGFRRALGSRLRAHVDALRDLERALAALPEDPRRAELLGYALECAQQIEAQLERLLEAAEDEGT